MSWYTAFSAGACLPAVVGFHTKACVVNVSLRKVDGIEMNTIYNDYQIRIEVSSNSREAIDRAYLKRFENAIVEVEYDNFGIITALVIMARG